MVRQHNARSRTWGERAPATTAAVRHDAANSIVRVSPATVEEVVYNAAGRPVGQLVRDGDGRLWLEKTGLDPAVHQLQKPRGWATDQAHIDMLRRRGGVGVRIIDVHGRVWTATIESFDRFGILFDRGHGRQTVLPERHWRCDVPGVRQLAFDDLLLAPAGAAGGAP